MSGARIDERPLRRLAHLGRRFAGSLSSRQPTESEVSWVREQLLAGEFVLWSRMSAVDQRHSIVVARRFVAITERPVRDEIAAALLHDVGKIASGLGTFGRVLATIIGPRTERFRSYHDHEMLGLRLAADAGSSPVTLELLRGEGRRASALRRADDV